MKHIKLFAVIVAMAICGTVSAQENFLKVSYSNVAIKASAGGISFTENMKASRSECHRRGCFRGSCPSSTNMELTS